MSGLLHRTREILGPLGFHALRGVEHLLSPGVLFSLLKPLALTRAAFDRKKSLPGYFRKPPLPETIREARTNYLLSRTLEFFPDRLSEPKWQLRFQTSGLHQIERARKNGHRVVLVCFHFGTFKLIPFWLRSLGIPVVALLRGKSQQRSRVKRMKDRLSPFPQLPTVLYNENQLRKVIEVLSAGHVLLLAVDRKTGRQLTMPIENDWSFRMSTGALRLASRCDAELIPCCMMDSGGWRFRLEIGEPVPRDYLASEYALPRAAEYLLQQMLPRVRNYPEQSSDYLLDCFRPNASSAVSEMSLA